MTANLPPPLVPAEVDLRDFAFMPLDVVRLRDSTLAIKATGEEFRAAVLIWCASWHQIPAGSLPDDDAELATFAGFGRVIREFKKVKAGAMRGWIKCEDGRLYHPVIAEKVLEAWNGKLRQQWKTECARIRKHNERHGTSHKSFDFDEWKSLGCHTGQALSVTCDAAAVSHGQDPCVVRENDSNRQGQGQGQGQLTTSEAKASGGEPPKITDPDEIIFGYGVPLLTNAGTAEKQARSFLGGLRKAHGDGPLIEKLRECLKAKPLQPLDWLAAALPPPSAAPRTGKRPAPENFENRDYGTGGRL